MKGNKGLLTIGLGTLAVGLQFQSAAASALSADGGSPIHRLHEIRRAYLSSIGRAEVPPTDSAAQVAQWGNFPNFPNFSNWNNWFNGWSNY